MKPTTTEVIRERGDSKNPFSANREKSHKRVRSGWRRWVIPSFLAFLAIFIPATLLASVEITHVEYDPPGFDTGHEWVEITNKGDAVVDVSKFKFLEGGVNHKLTLASGSALLAPGDQAIIASDPTTYLSDHAGSAQHIFKSSFSLSNTGETLALVNASGTVEYTTSYTAAPKTAAAPIKKSSTKTTTSSKSKSTSAKATANQATSYDNADASAAVIGSVKNIPPMVGWIAGLVAIIALGIAGALYARMGREPMPYQQASAPEDEFQIVES